MDIVGEREINILESLLFCISVFLLLLRLVLLRTVHV